MCNCSQHYACSYKSLTGWQYVHHKGRLVNRIMVEMVELYIAVAEVSSAKLT